MKYVVDSVKLVKILSKNNIAGNIQYLDENLLFYPFPPHHAVFLVDLNCENSSNLLLDVSV